jgi:hypothetical protein
MGGAKGLAGGALGFVTGAAGALFKAVEDAPKKIKDLAAVGKQADAVGVASDRYMGLAEALKKAGVEGDGVNTVLGRVARVTEQAAQGSTTAQATLARLGLTAADLINQPLDKQFISIAEAISKLPAGSQQAAAAMAIFGRSGAQLLPVLGKGGEGIEHLIAHSKALGLAIDPAKMAEVQRAAKLMKEADHAWEGLKQRVAVSTAPVISAIAGAVGAGFARIQPVLDKVAQFFEVTFFVAAQVLGEVYDRVTEVVNAIGSWAAEMLGLQGITITFKDVVFGVFRVIGYSAAITWDIIKAGAGAVTYVAGIWVEGFGQIVGVFKEIISLARLLPESARPDWLDGFIAGTDRFEKKVKGVGDQMRDWGKRQVRGFGDSMKDVDTWFEKIERKFNQADKKVQEQAKRVLDVEPAAAPRQMFVGALEKGSKEAYSIVARYQTGGLAGPLGDVPKRQLDEQKKANDHLKQIKERLDNLEWEAI